MRQCNECGIDYIVADKKAGGLSIHCDNCSNEPVIKYTGNMIYGHKTGCVIQINSDPSLTEYINGATKLVNKGSNLGNNLKVNSAKVRSNGLVYVADMTVSKTK